MPKELHEIKGFHLGTISNAESRDVPADSNITSENLNPIAEGRLEGIEEHLSLLSDGGFGTGTAEEHFYVLDERGPTDLGRISDGDKEHWVVGHCKFSNDDGQLEIISDPYAVDGGPTKRILGPIETVKEGDVSQHLTGTFAMESNNSEIHMGTGATAETPPQWIGKVHHKQLGEDAPATPYLDDAELKSPNFFTDFHAIVDLWEGRDSYHPWEDPPQYLYAVRWRGQHIYKIDRPTGKIVGRSQWEGAAIQGMCRTSDENLWVLDWNSEETSSDGGYTLVKVSSDDAMVELNSLRIRFRKDMGWWWEEFNSDGETEEDDTGDSGIKETYEKRGYVSGIYFNAQPFGYYPNEIVIPHYSQLFFHSYERGGFGESTSNYSCRMWAEAEGPLHDEEEEAMQNPFGMMPHTGILSETPDGNGGSHPWDWEPGGFANSDETENRMCKIDLPRGCPFYKVSAAEHHPSYTEGQGDKYFGVRAGIYVSTSYGELDPPRYYYGDGSGGQQSDSWFYEFSGEDGKRNMTHIVMSTSQIATPGQATGMGGEPSGPVCFHGPEPAESMSMGSVFAETFFGMCENWYQPFAANWGGQGSRMDVLKERGCTIEAWRADAVGGGSTNQTTFLRPYRPNSSGLRYFVHYDPDSGLSGMIDADDPINSPDDWTNFPGPLSGVEEGFAIATAVDIDHGLMHPYHSTGDFNATDLTFLTNVFDGESQGRWAHLEHKLTGLPNTYTNTVTAILEASLSMTFGGVYGSGFEGATTGKHFFKCSMTYDGYQDSPLGASYIGIDSLGRFLPTSTGKRMGITIKLTNLADLSKRVSHLNVFSAHAVSEDDPTPTGFYRLIEHLPLDNSWALTADPSNNPSWQDYYKRSFVWDGRTLESYDSLTGMSEELEFTMPHYGISAQLNNTLFIADCYHPKLPDAKQYIFKSQTFNFDQFDWSLDLLRLPSVPTALAAFNGRIYAFDKHTTYRIEPMNMYIEDTFEGVGCINRKSICVTEYGMCFADETNIYLHDGTTPRPIGDAITTNKDYPDFAWHNMAKTLDGYPRRSFIPIVSYDAKRNSFLIAFPDGNEDHWIWSYNIRRNRWDRLEPYKAGSGYGGEVNDITLLAIGKNGEVIQGYNAGADPLNHLAGLWMDDEPQRWSWRSQKLTMGQDTQYKNFKKVRINGTGNNELDSITGSESPGPAETHTADGDEGALHTITENGKQKWVQYKIQDAYPSSEYVNSIGTIFRRKSVK